MSSGFLTVEDINTLDINTVVNEYFVVDTSLIGTDEFSNVQYDFENQYPPHHKLL